MIPAFGQGARIGRAPIDGDVGFYAGDQAAPEGGLANPAHGGCGYQDRSAACFKNSRLGRPSFARIIGGIKTIEKDYQ